jgi:DnaJ-class molecular chaperone
MAELDYYDILGIKEDASESEIKKAYRALSLQYHPDRNQSDEAKGKMNLINEAYSTLGDKDDKKKYDHKRKFGGGFGGMNIPGDNDFQDINNIFNMMFAGAGMPPGMGVNMNGGPQIRVFRNGHGAQFHFNHGGIKRPDVIHKNVVITLEQSFNGCVIEVDVDRTIEKDDEVKKENETLYVNIPTGVGNNDVLTLQGKGNVVNTMISDIKIKVTVENKTPFIRQGLDIILKRTLTLKESLCGFLVEFTYLNGKKFAVNNKDNYTVIKPGFKKVIPGMGMVKENQKGNFILHFDIEFPNALEEDVRKKIEELL